MPKSARIATRVLLQREDFPGFIDPLLILQWFSTSVHSPVLVPGARILLSIPAGNGDLERTFAKHKAHLTPARLTSGCVQVRLAINGPRLGMSGYGLQFEADLGEASDDEAPSEGAEEDAGGVLEELPALEFEIVPEELELDL